MRLQIWDIKKQKKSQEFEKSEKVWGIIIKQIKIWRDKQKTTLAFETV